MARKLLMIGITLIGFTMAFGSNAWADRDRGDIGHRNDKGYHHNYKTTKGHHYGWDRGKGNPHKYGYQHSSDYRHRDRDHRWDGDRYHRDHHGRVVEKQVYHHYPRHDRRVVEKHVYHHYRSDDCYDHDRFNMAFSVVDQFFGVAVAVSGSR